MEGNSTIVADAARQMDEALVAVMPDYWNGHARLAIRAADLTEEQADFAVRLAERLMEKGKTNDAEKAGKLAAKKAAEKMS